MKKLIALLLALVMVLALVACGAPADPTTQPATKPTTQPTEKQDQPTDPVETPTEPQTKYPLSPIPVDNDPYILPKYTETVTADGWILVENEGGETLGYHPDSGVTILQVEGFAFKDLDQDGELDGYEDWRNSKEDRAWDLVYQMEYTEKASLMNHGGWGSFTTDPITEDNSTYAFLQAGGRGGVSRNISRGGAAHATWANNVQAVAESCFYGIPAMISIDPAGISGLIETLSLASTMSPELAAAIGNETAKQYRAAGVTALLGPQVDIASPIMSRGGGTYGEDPQLTLDITTAYVNAMQSTYDAEGNDLGWGNESVYCFTKHFAGAGSTEGGRDDHTNPGRYATFTGDNYEAHLITYFDGVFSLPGKTGSSGIMTEYAINVGPDGEPYGGEWSGAYSSFQFGMLDAFGFDSLVIADWGAYQSMGVWGAEDMEEKDRIALSWSLGANLLGNYSDDATIEAAYGAMVDLVGQTQADATMNRAAYHYIIVMMNLEMFENPYSDSAYADSIIASESAKDYGLETQRQSVVMIKNDGTIAAAEGEVTDKPTVYVPWAWNSGWSFSWMSGESQGSLSWSCPLDLEALSEYFVVVTDTLGEPSGTNEAGEAVYTKDDIIRASADEIAACDYILVGMDGAYTVSLEKTDAEGNTYWTPASLQYAEYTATTARETSLGGKVTEIVQYDNYGSVISKETVKENRSYKDQTAAQAANYGQLEALQYANSVAGDIPVIVSMNMSRGMVWTEVEPLADVILVCYNSQREEVVSEIILGQTEPNGLLVFQQPVNMEAVEAQNEDVPRDMECYVDANGNTYDFAFGMNWSGVINDERVAKYSAEPISELQNFDYDSYAANYGK